MITIDNDNWHFVLADQGQVYVWGYGIQGKVMIIIMTDNDW